MKLVMEGTEKRRVAGLISVGGSDQGWVSMGLSLMNTLLAPLQVKTVDQLQAVFAARPGQVLSDEKAIQKARRLGRNVAKAMRQPAGEVKFMGDKPGQCPVCHSDLLLVRKKPPVECPICGSRGSLKVEADEVTVIFDEEDLKEPHWSRQRWLKHIEEIRGVQEAGERKKDEVQKKLEKYRSYKSYSLPYPKVS